MTAGRLLATARFVTPQAVSAGRKGAIIVRSLENIPYRIQTGRIKTG